MKRQGIFYTSSSIIKMLNVFYEPDCITAIYLQLRRTLVLLNQYPALCSQVQQCTNPSSVKYRCNP